MRRKVKEIAVPVAIVVIIIIYYTRRLSNEYNPDAYHEGILKWYNYTDVRTDDFLVILWKIKVEKRLRVFVFLWTFVSLYATLSDEIVSFVVKVYLFEQSISNIFLLIADSLNGPHVQMDDPKLVQKLYTRFLIQPVEPKTHPYRLQNQFIHDPSIGQGEKIRMILKNKRNGFFVEVGALDGETRSNTLYFERFLNWTGLLIEPDPLNFKEMVKKNRRAWLSPSCLSVKAHPEIALFEQNSNMGKIVDTGDHVDDNKNPGVKTYVNVQCFPLYTYLCALNITNVDYLSLDVEGAELDVLKHIPFHLVNIQTLSVEFAHVPGGKEAIAEFMFSQGYVIHSEVTHYNWLANDFIFMKV